MKSWSPRPLVLGIAPTSVVKDWVIGYSYVMRKCEDGCTCGRHRVSDERRAKLSAKASLRRLTDGQKQALKCEPDCLCGKHELKNSGQFRPGSAGFTGAHTEETKAKLARYTGERASSFKHGWAGTPTYNTWSSMHSRCKDPRNASYGRYGGRGITVCDHWSNFENFLADMGKRPEGLTLDRIDGDGNYEPGNCRWATLKEQAANRRDGWIRRRASQE